MPPRIQAITALRLWFLPVKTRVPLKFGSEVLTSVICARVWLRIRGSDGEEAEGWGETPLSVQWVWPGASPFNWRQACLTRFCVELAGNLMAIEPAAHPLVLGHDFMEQRLPEILQSFNRGNPPAEPAEPMPWLAALLCLSPFDIALHDAYGHLTGRPVYETYGPDLLERDLAGFLEPANQFASRYPSDFFIPAPPTSLPVWHLVGGLDPLTADDFSGNEPQDGEPLLLADWIRRDGLKCLKIKLRGNDADRDYQRLVSVARIGSDHGVEHLSADFNCTVLDPEYVNQILDHLAQDEPTIFRSILYVEQPFPYDLERHGIDVHSVSARKPLFLDESAHDWRMVRLGMGLGWTGVALKTCKTQTGAILTACWAKMAGLQLMVQDLTNPMLAQIPHLQLAAHLGTIMGVESNAMQFYPDASAPESRVHPGLYSRRHGRLDLSSISGAGFGYRVDQINRVLPSPVLSMGMS